MSFMYQNFYDKISVRHIRGCPSEATHLLTLIQNIENNKTNGISGESNRLCLSPISVAAQVQQTEFAIN